MRTQSLNGTWMYRIGHGAESPRQIPFSALAVGHSECRRTFIPAERAGITLLKFHGITYAAKVTLNGKYLGDMLPYCEYVFDISDTVTDGENELLVELEDFSPAFGPTEGWENYGGIIRDVELLYGDTAYIRDVFFHTELTNGYTDALYTVETEISAPAAGEIRVTLTKDGAAADQFTIPAGGKMTDRLLSGVRLWSPDDPQLYTLAAELYIGGCLKDTYKAEVGFRSFTCDRHRFYLNGQPLFLRGVCRHEMMGDSGHTVDPADTERDLRMIKDTGCNFVRLVHYPHGKRTLEIADRLGLMVSEEPGLWWSDTADPEVSAGSIEILRRTILRDRNHASVMFWLCFNECRFTEQFLIDSAEMCRRTDPTRLVSGANCMGLEDTKKYYNICGFDFYTMHPYAPTFDRSMQSVKYLNDKPLLFTEWGGYFVYDNPHLFTDFIHTMADLYRQNSDEGALAGAFFWYWAEVNDFHRGGPACRDGVLKEALVDKDRNPTMIYKAFCEAWDDAPVDPVTLYKYTPLDTLAKTALTPAVTGDYAAFLARNQAIQIPAKRLCHRPRKITVGPRLAREEIPGMLTTPAVLRQGCDLAFTGETAGDTLTVLGAVSAPFGYPIAGEYGETAAELTVTYADGTSEIFPLRNGVEITTVYTTAVSSRIDPRAQRATPFARFSYEKDFENYLINRLDLPLSGTSAVTGVTLHALHPDYEILIYGLFL